MLALRATLPAWRSLRPCHSPHKGLSSAAVSLHSRSSFSTGPSDGSSVKVDLSGSFTLYTPDGFEDSWTEPPLEATATKDELVTLLRNMLIIRRLEQVSDKEYKAKKIRGFCHLYLGQEGVCTGLEAAIDFRDCMITAYRDHGNQLARGDTPYSIFCEMLGKFDGCSKGKGGSMHLYHRKNNFYGGNGIVGAQTPVGAGLAFAQKYKGENHISFACYGDGAANQGQLSEAINMAALWKLPIVFVCENNHFGMGTPANRSSADFDYFTRGQFVPGIRVDGMNVLAVREATRHVASWVRAGNGPCLMEFDTYRYSGHSMSDPGYGYRSKEEVKAIQTARDPIEALYSIMVSANMITPEEREALVKEVRKYVEGDMAAADKAPLPNLDEMYTDVYADNSEEIRGVLFGTGYDPSTGKVVHPPTEE